MIIYISMLLRHNHHIYNVNALLRTTYISNEYEGVFCLDSLIEKINKIIYDSRYILTFIVTLYLIVCQFFGK